MNYDTTNWNNNYVSGTGIPLINRRLPETTNERLNRELIMPRITPIVPYRMDPFRLEKYTTSIIDTRYYP